MPLKSQIEAPGARQHVFGRGFMMKPCRKNIRISMTELARRLNIPITSIGKSVSRGEELVKNHRYALN